MARKPVWRTDIIGSVNEKTGRRDVRLPSLTHVGIDNATRDAIYQHEVDSGLGTWRAANRIQQRAQGHKVALKEPTGDLNRFGKPKYRPIPGQFRPMVLIPKALKNEDGSVNIPPNLLSFYLESNVQPDGTIVVPDPEA